MTRAHDIFRSDCMLTHLLIKAKTQKAHKNFIFLVCLYWRLRTIDCVDFRHIPSCYRPNEFSKFYIDRFKGFWAHKVSDFGLPWA